MPTPLVTTVLEIQASRVIVSTPDGQQISLPTEAVIGKPELKQPLFLIAASSANESGSQHALAQTIIEHLLEPLT